jgi:hypothetical protein
MTKPGKTEKSAARSQRLSAALRENLKRRKAQARARSHAPDGEATSQPAQAEPELPDFRRNPGGK